MDHLKDFSLMNEVWAKSKWLRRCSSCIDSTEEGRKIECVGIEFEIIVVSAGLWNRNAFFLFF